MLFKYYSFKLFFCSYFHEQGPQVHQREVACQSGGGTDPVLITSGGGFSNVCFYESFAVIFAGINATIIISFTYSKFRL